MVCDVLFCEQGKNPKILAKPTWNDFELKRIIFFYFGVFSHNPSNKKFLDFYAKWIVFLRARMCVSVWWCLRVTSY